jgi:aspartyl-tRNA(Asn)/glutamyl-tRNA(Gln) amidotransferase subunit A
MSNLSQPIETVRLQIAQRTLSATALCEEALARIEQCDEQLQAMTDVLASSALKEAVAIDRSLSHGEPVGQLAGIPITVKSNIDTAGALCDAGLPHLHGNRPVRDAEVVARLRRAGAVILGTTVTDNGGFGVTTPVVINPLLGDRIAGGSSGGAAAAVAAGYCIGSIGTDTGGSVRIPAACCGVVGFKPTYGRIPTEGVRPLASSIDHVGVLARSASDVFSIYAAIDADFSKLAERDQSKMPVIGIAKSYIDDAASEVRIPFFKLIDQVTSLGYAVREVTLPSPEEALNCHLVLALTEAALIYHNSDLGPEDRYPEAVYEGLRLGLAYTGTEHLRALKLRRYFVGMLQSALCNVDFIALPTLPSLPPLRSDTTVTNAVGKLDVLGGMIRYTSLFNQTGHPVIAMPWRSPMNLQIASVQLVGPLNSDRQLLMLAMKLEREISGFGNAHPV